MSASFSGRLAMIGLLSALCTTAACDRGSPPQGQAEANASAPSPDEAAPATPAATRAGAVDRSHAGERPPQDAFTDASGTRTTLADFKGAPVLVNLWATWCGPCVLEMPTLEKLAAKYDGRLTVLTVSQDLGQQDKITALFAAKGFTRLHPWLDPDNTLSNHYQTGVLPTTVLYDKDGKEVWRMVGGHDWSNAETDALLKDTVGG